MIKITAIALAYPVLLSLIHISSGNLYFNGARAWEKETDAVTDTEHSVDSSVEEKEDGWYLKTNLYDIIKEETDGIISTETLGMAFEPEQKYENPDGDVYKRQDHV